MAAKSEGEQKREAYRAEYAVVGSVWQSLQRERFFLVGVFVTTAGVLFGIFSTGTRSVGVSADDAIAATLARNTPL
jgi:hypothetical protein